MRLALGIRPEAAAVLGAVAVLGTVTVVIVLRGDSIAPQDGTAGRDDVRVVGAPFTISGDAVEPLWPGRSVPVDVKLTNPADTRLTVTGLRVEVDAVTAPNADEQYPCSPLDFAVSQVPADLAVSVPARATWSLSSLGVPREAWPRVRMVDRPVNQDGCKGASVSLSYVGSGRSGP